MVIPYPWEALRDLCKAIGIDPDKTLTDKIVIVAAVDDVVRVYVRGMATEEQIHSVAGVIEAMKVKNVTVSDEADVAVIVE